MKHGNSDDFTKKNKKISNHEGISNFSQNKVKIWQKNKIENGPGGGQGFF